jgi:hypothetical protein
MLIVRRRGAGAPLGVPARVWGLIADDQPMVRVRLCSLLEGEDGVVAGRP